MKILSDNTVTTVTRTIEIADGPRLSAGPEWYADIEVGIDTVIIQSNRDAVASGYRFRYGQFNKSYRHTLRYSRDEYPEWLRSLLVDAYLADADKL